MTLRFFSPPTVMSSAVARRFLMFAPENGKACTDSLELNKKSRERPIHFLSGEINNKKRRTAFIVPFMR